MGPGELFALGCALAWAVSVILFRISGEHLPPFALNLVKNAMVLPLFGLTLWIVDGPGWPDIGPRDLAIILFSGLVGIGIGDTLYFRALNAIGASRMAVAQALYSPFVILLAMAWLGERLRLWQFAGVGLVLCGIVLVTWNRGGRRHDHRAVRAGVAWAVISVFFMALGVVIAKPMLAQHSFLWVATLRIVAGLSGMVVIAVARRQLPALWNAYRGVTHWPLIVAGGVMGTYVSMMLWLAGFKYTQASIAAVLNELAAVFILPMAAFVLREPVRVRQTVGVMLALGGVGMVVSL